MFNTIQVLDSDRSGGLDSQEFCAAMKKLVGRRFQRPNYKIWATEWPIEILAVRSSKIGTCAATAKASECRVVRGGSARPTGKAGGSAME